LPCCNATHRAPSTAERYVPERHAIAIWHMVVSGFTQRLAQPCGCQQLWNNLGRAHDNCRAKTLLLPWNADWPGVAELIWRFRPLDRPPRIYVYAYSWGGGWGFPQLATELGKRSIDIEHAVLSDAVYRPRLRSLAWLAMTPFPRVVVPANVRAVDWFFQREDRTNPCGHRVVAADPDRTRVAKGIRCNATHHYMDDHPAWWLRCLEVAAHARVAPAYHSPESQVPSPKSEATTAAHATEGD
jgi:hypothetical protein